MESANDKELDQLLNEHFAGRVVRKDLTKLIKEGANVTAVPQFFIKGGSIELPFVLSVFYRA